MTTLEQALHIFRKDARHLRLEIGGVLLLILILIVSGIQSWEDIQEGGRVDMNDNPMIVLLPLAWALLIARAIQTEALPGDRQFWLTRPYSRTGLVASKLLFAAAFVHLPLLLAQSIIVAADGLSLFSSLGGLLWNQVWLAVFIVLPVAAIASLTRNLAQFLPLALVGWGFLALIVAIGEERNGGWVGGLLGLTLAAGTAAYAVWRQYQLRRSMQTTWRVLAACAMTFLVAAAFPNSAAFAVQSTLIGAPSSQFSMALLKPEPQKPTNAIPNKYVQTVRLPITVTGANARDLKLRAGELTLRTLSGMTRKSWTKVDATDTGFTLYARVDRDFFEKAKNAPVSLRGEYEITQWGDGAATSVPIDGAPVLVPGVGQCGAAVQWDERHFYCRAAFRDPGAFASDRITGGEFASQLPFPSLPGIYPVFGNRYTLVGGADKELAPAAPELPATITARKRVAYFRHTFEATNVRLADYAAGDPKDEE